MYIAFARSAFQTRLAYRGQVWAAVFAQLVVVFAKIAIWMSVYRGVESVDGVTLREMITYAIISGTVLAAWEWQDLLNDVGRSIRTGNVAVYLLKPLRYPLYLFSTELGNLGFRLIAVVLPTVVIVGLAYGLDPPASAIDGAAFVAFWLLSFLILFLFSALAGLIAFWLFTVFSLEWLLMGILSVLSGTFIPLWFFPAGLAAIVKILPFAYIGYYPTAVYLGKLAPGEVFAYLGLGIVWALVLSACVALLWRKAANRIVVQCG